MKKNIFLLIFSVVAIAIGYFVTDYFFSPASPDVVAKLETNTTSDVSAGLGQSNGPLAKLKQLGKSVKDTVSDVLDKPIISERVETPEMEARSKAEFELVAKKNLEWALKNINNHFPTYRIITPIKTTFRHYEVEKTISGSLRYAVLVELSYKSHEEKEGVLHNHDLTAFTATRELFIDENGNVSYSRIKKIKKRGTFATDSDYETGLEKVFTFLKELQKG